MRVLFLTHRVPYPPDKGDRIRSFHLLRHLARRHKVFLAALADEPVSEASERVLAQLCEEVAVVPHGQWRWARALHALAMGKPLTTGLFHAPRLQRQLSEWASEQRFDVVIGYCSSMAQYLVAQPLDKLPALVDLVDVDSAKWQDYSRSTRGWRRWLYGLEARRLRRLESQLAQRCSALTVVSEREAAAYREIQPAGRVAVVPNGVDLEFFHEVTPMREATRLRDEAATTGNCCTFIGALDYFPNVDGVCWFCEHVWPQVRRRRPDATLTLVGRNPNRPVQRLAGVPGIQVVGTVPDVRPYLRQAQLAIAPLRIARGVQNKVLEAMAMSRPVVVSPQAAEGLPRLAAEAAMVAAEPEDWAEQIEQLLASPELARQRGAVGRRAVESACCWESCLAEWEALLEEAAAVGRNAEPARRPASARKYAIPAGSPAVHGT